MFTMKEFCELNGLTYSPSLAHKLGAELRSRGYVRGWGKKPGDSWFMRYWGKPEEFNGSVEGINCSDFKTPS